MRSKKDLFPQYCIKKPRQASALPRLFSLSCRKISLFGVLRSFEAKIFSHKSIQRTQECFVYFKDDGFLVGKKIDSKPYESLCESAQRQPAFLIENGKLKIENEPKTHVIANQPAGWCGNPYSKALPMGELAPSGD